MSKFFPATLNKNFHAMVFVDGENLAIRYGNMLRQKDAKPSQHILYKPSVYVWSKAINNICLFGGAIRKHYYTSVSGDQLLVTEVVDELKSYGIEAPKVFKKTKTRGSKRVDITLTADMLLHASRKNYDIAVLIAGDEDYVPLVEAVMSEGCQVFVWFIEDGISPLLRRTADYYADLGKVLFAEKEDPYWR